MPLYIHISLIGKQSLFNHHRLHGHSAVLEWSPSTHACISYICILRVRFSLYWKKKEKKKKKHIHVTLPSTGLTEHWCNSVPGLSQSQIHLTFVCVFYYRGTSSWNEFCLVLKSRPGFLILIDYFYTRGGGVLSTKDLTGTCRQHG